MAKRNNWTLGMINALLNHLDDHKGEGGLYVTNRAKAYEDASKALAHLYPSRQVSTRQVCNKLTDLCNRERQVRSVLFLEGRRILRAHCDQDVLLRNDSGSREKKTSLNAGFSDNLTREVAAPRLKSRQQKKKLRSKQVNAEEYVPPRPPESNFEDATLPSILQSEDLQESYSVAIQPCKSPSIGGTNPSVRPPEPNFENIHYPSNLLHEDKQESRSVAIQEYLMHDAELYIPTIRALVNLQLVLIPQIATAIQDLLESARTGLNQDSQSYTQPKCERPPVLFEALSQPSFFDICKRIYGAGTQSEVLMRSQRSFVLLEDFLRAMLAAAVTEWIFDGHHGSLPTDLTYRCEHSKIYESRIAEVCPELHKQLLLETNYIFVNKRSQTDLYARDFSSQFTDALLPFLRANNIRWTKESQVKWYQNLDKVFSSSLKLRAQVSLRDGDPTYHWPRFDEQYDPKCMETMEKISGRPTPRVQMPLFPALIERGSSEAEAMGQEELIVFRAKVTLQ